MLSTTRTAIVAILSTDPSFDKERIKAAMSAIDAGYRGIEPMPRIVSRQEVADILGVTTKRIDQLAQAGTLKRVILPGTSRAIGFREEDIRKITSSVNQD